MNRNNVILHNTPNNDYLLTLNKTTTTRTPQRVRTEP